MRYEEFVEEVMHRAGVDTPAEAERAIAATLETLGERMLDGEVQALAGDLPARLVRMLARRPEPRDFDRRELYRLVHEREDVDLGFAIEHAEVVCQVLAEALSPSALVRLQRHLPDLADLVTVREPEAPPPEAAHGLPRAVPPPDTTLAGGRPASRHPVSEAQPERAQSESVVRSDNPHGESKVSSSRGLTQERRHETLAAGKPGPKRSISGG